MPRAIRNAANNVSAASQEVDNAATWASVTLSKINEVLDAIQQQKSLDLEVEIPLGDNIAKIFGKDHLTIDGKAPIIKATIRVKLPTSK